MSEEFKEKMKLDVVPTFLVIAKGTIAAQIRGVKYVELVEALNKFIPELGEE